VQLSSDNVLLDLRLCQYGDVNADGKRNLGDTARMSSHMRGTEVMQDDYAQQCADMDQNGKLNLGDVSRCYATVRRT
jgi:hypothetical protein